jgi:hypothetical protein
MGTNGFSTAGDDLTGSWSPRQMRVGACILKVEQQEEYLLITVTTNSHLGRSLTSARPETTTRYARPADALRAAERFLESFT